MHKNSNKVVKNDQDHVNANSDVADIRKNMHNDPVIDIELMKEHMQWLNLQAQWFFYKFDEKTHPLETIFIDCPQYVGQKKHDYNAKFVTNWLLNRISDSFAHSHMHGSKNNYKPKQRISQKNELNLQCIEYLFHHRSKLERSIDLIIKESHTSVDDNKDDVDDEVTNDLKNALSASNFEIMKNYLIKHSIDHVQHKYKPK